MKKFLSEEEFNELRPQLLANHVKLHVSKSISRQFFMRVSNASIIETTGESMKLQKVVVWSGFVFSLLLALTSLVFIILEFGWGAALAAPLVGIMWTILAGFTSDLGTWIHSVVALALALALAWALPMPYAVPLVMLTISIVVLRSVNEAAQYWTIMLVSRSFPAYDMMVEHIVLEYPDATP